MWHLSLKISLFSFWGYLLYNQNWSHKISTQRCPQPAILSEQMFGRCVINIAQLSSCKIPCFRLYCSYHRIHQVHGDGCFDTGPISLSLTGNYPDVNHHGHETLWESSQLCSEPALKRLHWKRIHLLLWSLRGYGKEVIGFIEWAIEKYKKNFRCDQKADCDDQTDEASCQIVHLNPEQYLKESILRKSTKKTMEYENFSCFVGLIFSDWISVGTD